MSRLVLIAIVSLLAGFSTAAVAGEFVDDGLVAADVLDLQDGGSAIDASLDFNEGLSSANSLFDRGERERDMRDCRRRGDCNNRRPMPPPRRPTPSPGYGYVCYAENEYRQIYTGRDRLSARFAQAEAMDSCNAYSRRCRPLGCDRY